MVAVSPGHCSPSASEEKGGKEQGGIEQPTRAGSKVESLKEMQDIKLDH